MNKEDIIRMAREAGAVFPADGSYHKFEFEGGLERFAALVAADAVEEEREECAKLCDYLWESKAAGAYEGATAIRKRGNYE